MSQGTGTLSRTFRAPGPAQALRRRLLDVEKSLSYDDVALDPRVVSHVASRGDCDTSVQLGPAMLDVPLVAAPMPDVCDYTMSRALAAAGAIGIVHRFQPYRDQVENHDPLDPIETGAAIGISAGWQDRFYFLLGQGIRIFCIDTANGANIRVKEVVDEIRRTAPWVFIIAGNVSSSENFSRLQAWGVGAIRVGIAGGSVCETKTETGILSPMASAVLRCSYIKDKALLIADGGIRTPADMVKAIGLGADLVMCGGVFAGAKESPGNVIVVDGKKFKLMRGAASFSTQQQIGNDPVYIEGAETLVPYKGPVAEIVDRYKRGLQSAMSYFNAKTINEFQLNATFVKL